LHFFCWKRKAQLQNKKNQTYNTKMHSSHVYAKKTDPKAIIPKKTPRESFYPLRSLANVTIAAKTSSLVSTGISFDLPKDLYARVEPLNSFTHKGVLTSTAVVGQGENSEVKVLMFNTGNDEINIKAGEVIAQVVIDMVLKVHLHELLEDNNAKASSPSQ